jgi:hypothetical protein
MTDRGHWGAQVVLLLIATFTGCARVDKVARWTEADSAGIHVIISQAEAPPWHLSPSPLLSLGVVDQGGPEEFSRIQDLEILDDGGVAVANGGSEEVRIFSADGRHVGNLGRRGRGPGEFSGLYVLEQLADSLITFDLGNARVSVWTKDLSVARSYSMNQAGTRVPDIVIGVLREGEVIAVRPGRDLTPGLVVESVLISRYGVDGDWVDSVARLPVREMFVSSNADGQTVLPAPFTAAPSSLSALLAVTDRNLCHTFGPEYEFRCYDTTGRAMRIVRVSRPPRTVEQTDISRFWDDVSEMRSGPRRESYLKLRSSLPFPAALPGFAQILSNDSAQIWARVYDPLVSDTREWLIFDAGRLAGRLSVPANFQIIDVEGPLVAGVETDSLGVEVVRIYQVVGT